MSEFQRQTVLVSGALGDLGWAISLEFASRGANVVGCDLRDAAGPEAARWRAEVDAAGGQALYRAADIRRRAEVDAWVDAAVEAFGGVQVLCANAGVVRGVPFLDVSEDDWTWHIDTNLTGGFHVAQAVARQMVRAGEAGRIVFTGSWVQDVPWPEDGPYCASKGGLKMLARVMALELAPHGIRVNIVAPGIVAAGLAGRQLQTEPQYAARIARVVPLGALGTAEQVAHAVRFTASGDAAYMTGATLLLDGGASLFQFNPPEQETP